MATAQPNTTDQLLEILDRVQGKDQGYDGSPCSECRELAGIYTSKILTTKAREEGLAEKVSEEDKTHARNFLALRVKLEATTARRFLLHVLERHN